MPIKGHAAGSLTIWLDGKQVLELADEGSFQVEVPLSYGQHDLVIRSVCEDITWGYTLQGYLGGEAAYI